MKHDLGSRIETADGSWVVSKVVRSRGLVPETGLGLRTCYTFRVREAVSR